MSAGLLLTLLTALGWAAFDVTRKGLAMRVSPLALTVWLPLAQAPLLAAWALGAGSGGIPPASLLPMAASMTLNVAGLLWFMQAVRLAPLSLTIPLLSFTPVGTTLLAWAFRGQVPSLPQWTGIALIVGGAAILGLRTGTWPGLRGYLRDGGVRRMAGAALIWSLTAVLDQAALQRGAGAWYAPALSAGVGLLLGLLLLGRGQWEVLREAAMKLRGMPLFAMGAALLGGAALAVQLEALRVAPVGFVETVKRGLGMAAAVVFGRLVFKEPITLPKVLAVALMTAGVTLVVGWELVSLLPGP